MPKTLSQFRGDIQARAVSATRAEVLIYGDIGNPWDEESPQARDVVVELSNLDVEEIDLRVNSYGGSVADGLAIFNALDRHPARVIGHNDGVAASMGSGILMAADEVVAADASLFMVHAPWGFSMGNARDMREAAKMLDTFAATLTVAYARRVDPSTVAEWMAGDQDFWLTASEAVDVGLADTLSSEAADGALAMMMCARYRSGSSLPPVLAAWASNFNKGGPLMAKKTVRRTVAAEVEETTPDTEVEETAETSEETTPDTEVEETSEETAAEDTEVEETEPAGVEALASRNAEVVAIFAPFRARAGMADLERHYLTEGLAASVDDVRATVLAKLGEGVEPVGGPQFSASQDTPSAANDDDPEEYHRLIQAHVDGGMSRRDAIKRVSSEHPRARLAFLQSRNPRQAENVAALAQIDV